MSTPKLFHNHTWRHMYRIIICLSLAVITFGMQAQSNQTLSRFELQTGELSANTTDSWAFDALADEVLTIRVEATDTTLDPIMVIRDPNNTIIFRNDDLAYPNNVNPLAEAITIPRTGNYTVEITGFAGTSGAYTIQLLLGYGALVRSDTFDNPSSWATDSDLLENTIADGQLALSIEGLQENGLITPNSTNTFEDFFAQVEVTAIDGRNGWETGIIIRQQDDAYYQFGVNSIGTWQFSLIEGESRQILRDYVPHPAIVPGETTFTLGVLANEGGFDVFYNQQFMGQVTDSILLSGGKSGIYLQTANAIGGAVSAQYDNFIITSPFTINDEPIFPDNLVVGTPQQIVQELERRRVIAPDGNLPLNVPESFVDSRTPGVVQQPLGRGATFTNFVMGTTAAIIQNARPDLAACGLLLQSTDENDYVVAFVDNAGGYGISSRNGDIFDEGLFNINPEWANNAEYNLIVVVLEDLMHLYVNSQYMGRYMVSAQDGQVGNVLINFEATETSCEFSDTWLWQLN